MDGPVGSVHMFVILTAVLGGVFAVFGMIATYKKLFTKKNINKIYYVSYALMAISMFLWALRGLMSPE